MENEKSIEVLNTLIQINNDRIEGYQTALDETEESDLKTLFTQFIGTSKNCKQELQNEVHKLGGTATDETKVSGKFFRVWMDVKAALTNKDRKSILNSCEFGEDAAVKTYKNTLENDVENISAQQQVMISHQYALIMADHNKVKSLRDVIKD